VEGAGSGSWSVENLIYAVLLLQLIIIIIIIIIIIEDVILYIPMLENILKVCNN